MDKKTLIDDIVDGYNPSAKELQILLEAEGSQVEYLLAKADDVRRNYLGKWVHIRGIIEFSNYCRCQCLYCGLQVSNKDIKRYRMMPDEIIQTAKTAYDAGYKTLVLQSGEDPWYTREKISYIIKKIKELGDIAITLSVGERDFEDYKQWKRDGADRFLLKHETSNKNLYKKLHPGSLLEDRINCLKELLRLGYQVGSGFMIGLPGQTLLDIANDILLLKKLDIHMAGIGPFIPHQQTVLYDKKIGSGFFTLKALALSRILLKDIYLPATTALLTENRENLKKAFFGGANVIMLKVQSHRYRRLYDIYPKKHSKEKSVKAEREDIENFIKDLDLKVSTSCGDIIKMRDSVENLQCRRHYCP